jgi:Peptidase family M28
LILRLAFWLLLVLPAALGIYDTRPPAALGLNAPPGQFSAARAISWLPHFATQPHPTGSEANEKVRAYLVATLRTLGAEVAVEQTTGRRLIRGVVRQREVQNIVARLPGTDNHRAVMLVAHYDSVPAGPGAADDGAGVSTILEVLRAGQAGAPLQNDLLILLTDGEEAGLLGAAGFAADHPDLSRRVGVLVNLEARGSSGPALMFETSDRNGWLIPEFARAAPYPLASSLMYAAYRLMPNDTDLTELKKTGVGAFNFAFTETDRNYHSPNDTLVNLDPRSVQQMGANTLALVRHFGALPLTEVHAPDCIYFNWIGPRLLVYPRWVGWVLAAVTFALLSAALLLGRRAGRLKLSFASLEAFFILLLFVSGGTLLAWSALKPLLGHSLGRGDTWGNLFFFAALVGLGFLIGGLSLRWLSARLGARNLAGGMLVVSALLATLVLCLLPGASYVLQWPALLGAGSLLLGLRAHEPVAQAGWAMLAAVPVTLLLAPLGFLFFENLGLSLPSLGANAILLSLLLASSWPAFDFLLRAEP